jgi:hypothetical protein
LHPRVLVNDEPVADAEATMEMVKDSAADDAEMEELKKKTTALKQKAAVEVDDSDAADAEEEAE